jgi:hypothetical protein
MSERLPDNLPDEIVNLDEPVAVFQAGTGQVVLYWIIGCLALLLGLGILGVVAVGLAKGEMFRGIFKGALVGIFLIGAAAGILQKARRARTLAVSLYPSGLTYEAGPVVEMVSWKEVSIVQRVIPANRNEFTINTPLRFQITTADGRVLEFTESLSGIKELRSLVEENTLRPLLARSLESYRAGENTMFGCVKVDRQGIRIGANVLEWDEFEGAELAKGKIVLRRKGINKPFCYLSATDVPNYHVFLALTEHAQRS